MIRSILFAALVTGAACCLAEDVKPKVQGYATQRVRERLDRGLVAMRKEAGQVYLGWRLLNDDPADIAFNIYRRSGPVAVKLNAEPIRRTTDFVDRSGLAGAATYFLRPLSNGREGPATADVGIQDADHAGYMSIRLQGDYCAEKIGIGDLDGDGRYDYVIKQPNENIDPYEKLWRKSPETYKLEAYDHDGKFLWRYDLGWAIERGIWYSPFVVYDLDGDGKAEVAVKTGEGDPRGPDGHVESGPEYLTILDGTTGKPITRVDWPSRDLFSSYNYASRNQMCVAYLDGKTPCLIVERGTYQDIVVVAYEYHNRRLRELWRWDNKHVPQSYWGGRGADNLQARELWAVRNSNGTMLWSWGQGATTSTLSTSTATAAMKSSSARRP